MRIPSLVGAIALVLSGLTHGHEVGAELRYRLVKLDRNGFPAAINKQGTIAARARIEGIEREILWRRSGAIIVVGASSELSAHGLNDRGQVVGVATRPDMIAHGFVWTRGRLRDIGDLPGGADRSSAADINKRGQVVGSSATAAGSEAILWEHGNLMSLGDLPGGATHSEALAINELGTIVGLGSTDHGFRPFVWRDGVMKELRLPPELRQSDFARALDINKSGVIVGSAVPVGSPDDIAIALVWPSHNEEARVLPLPPGASLRNAIAFAVNDRGDIVGEAFPSDDFGFAVIWRNEGATVTILPGLVVDPDPRHRCDTLDMAVDINQRGEIAAASFDTCGPRFEERDAYRLVPVKP